MGTSDRNLEWFLNRMPEGQAANLRSFAAGELGRQSIEASVARRTGTIRAMRSFGSLRLHGDGIQTHSAELSHVGLIATAWQKAVSATGAALERVQSLRGALPAEITQRTTLLLSTAPTPGSIVLHLEPQSQALDEVEPHGNVAIIEPSRPLADRASSKLISLLGDIGSVRLEQTESLAISLRELGPRVGSTLSQLAQAIHRSNITIDASWAEPGASLAEATINPNAAKWIRNFVAGRGLDAEEQYLAGTLRTVSDRERWLIELDNGETERMAASELPEREVAKWRVGAAVQLRVRVALREQPDGTVRRTFTILQVSAVDD
ncbi:hypothetical protein AB0O34_21070 [Sphaerisporangium sp. NPDC088356]|uniref:hypothetical protein n=1 Tax=Sphaerisporangium sp. NPDC088356 TaxID=3154871 RepID=UPI00341C3993